MQFDKKFVTPIVIAAVVVGIISFYGGMKYGASQSTIGQYGMMGGRNGGAQFDQNGNRTGRTGMMRGGGMGFTSGEILSVDDKSITVKMRDGGSKIIFLGASTQILKSTEGATSDLVTGKEVTINGTPNADGSITAQMVQLRPALPQPTAGTAPTQKAPTTLPTQPQ